MTIRTLVVVGAVIIAGMVAMGAWALLELPADTDIPVHWDLDGRPDRYAPAWVGLFGMPVLAAGVVALLAFLPRMEPRRANLERSYTAYVGIGVAIIALLATLQVAVVASARGLQLDVAAVALVGLGLLLIVIGNYLSKTRSNWMMGIRTPWTLSSERSWARTHRLSGLLFIADGLLVVLATLAFGAPVAIWVMLVLLALSTLAGVVFSYLVWRKDPDRREGVVGR